jgi:hypothetical protein
MLLLSKIIPQGLKAESFPSACFGTAKAVPFQDIVVPHFEVRLPCCIRTCLQGCATECHRLLALAKWPARPERAPDSVSGIEGFRLIEIRQVGKSNSADAAIRSAIWKISDQMSTETRGNTNNSRRNLPFTH